MKIALIFLAIGLLLGTLIVLAATPSSTIYISSGVYPGAPSYTVWKEGSNYFAKDSNGLIAYSGTNASDILQNCFDQLTDGGRVLLQNDITLTTRVEFSYNGIELIANGIKTVTITFTYAGECIRIGDGTTKISYGAIKHLQFEGATSFSVDQYAIHGNYSTGITIEDCEFHSMWGNNSWAIVLERSSAYHIQHNRLWNNYNGIKMNGSSSNTINEIFDNYITRAVGWDDNSYGTAIWVGNQGSGTKITDNCLENHNIRIHSDANNVIIKGNYFEWDDSKYLVDLQLDGGKTMVSTNQFSENVTVTGDYNCFGTNEINDLQVSGDKNVIVGNYLLNNATITGSGNIYEHNYYP